MRKPFLWKSSRRPCLASLRRLIRPANLPPLARIRSFAYFQSVIAELQQQQLPEGYVDYLRLKFQQAAEGLSNDAQKRRFLLIGNRRSRSGQKAKKISVREFVPRAEFW
jgi:hypothetical protein